MDTNKHLFVVLLFYLNVVSFAAVDNFVTAVKKFDDVRNKDLSQLSLSAKGNIIRTLIFNNNTIWPSPDKIPTNISPEQIMQTAMNPGLGVRQLHKQGITGKGVNVAIIDQPLFGEHPEYAGKIAAYYDTGCGNEKTSMHGPAVTSLLVGTNCGTAPNAKVYYAAVPSWNKDSAYYAKAIDWIIEQNNKLPLGQKIRVISVSAWPSGKGTPFEKNTQMWDEAYERAERNGIMVLDCTGHHGFIGRCWYSINSPDNFVQCTPGSRIGDSWFNPDEILIPASVRTTAEEKQRNVFTYIYWGNSGTSWTRPYCAGVLAMGWQIRPELTPQQMKELLFKSAYIKNNAKIINPVRFIQMVKDYKK